MRTKLFTAVGGLLAAAACCQPLTAAPLLPYYGAATFDPGAAIDNPLFPVTPGQTRRYEAVVDGEVVESFEFSYGGMGPSILGIQTTVMRDAAYEEDLLVELTYDFYAQDTAGNVWYFGEDVTNYVYDDEGELLETNTHSSWRGGVNDALPGLIMPAFTGPGFSYFQEFAAADEALDTGFTLAENLDIATGFGEFSGVLKVLEGTTLDPAVREVKYYAPGFGLVMVEEGVDANLMNPELTFEMVSAVPVPPAIWLLGSAVASVFGWRRQGAAAA
ncbi:MAG: hypothetical protein H6978_13085 [Gammaproteobacteria bacterium]|nr:hypothetical protein [Gammaproteobacteria bacterium]